MQEQQSSSASVQSKKDGELADLAQQLREAQAAAEKADSDARRDSAGAQVCLTAEPQATCVLHLSSTGYSQLAGQLHHPAKHCFGGVCMR